MVRLIVIMMLAVGLVKADSIIVDVGAKSKHLIVGDFNEQHDWKGIGYRFTEEDNYSAQVKYVEFVNSYSDDTRFLALTGLYTPIKWRDIKLGVSGSIGVQHGYYVNNEGTVHPNTAQRLGMTNESILVLYSLYGEFDNFIVNYTYIPDSVEAITFGYKIKEW